MISAALPPALYTLHEASQIIGVHPKYIYRIVKRGDLEVESVNGTLRVSREEVYRYMKSREK